MSKHGHRFLKIVTEAKKCVREIDIQEVQSRLEHDKAFCLVDVREEREWTAGHLPQAIHLGKGVIECDIEKTIRDIGTEIVLYCGGGYRSALAAQNLIRMGYENVWSMAGGIKAWKNAGFVIVRDPC